MIRKQILFFLFVYLTNLSAFTQEYNYQHYELKEGLSGLTVYSIAQDKDSYLWFGTETGLSRFDGSHFTNFSTNDGLPDNEILKLYVDSRNRVWILPFTNSICYYYKGKIHNQKNDSVLAKIKFNSEPVDIGEDKEGNIVILEHTAIHLLRKNDYTLIANLSAHGFTCSNIGLNALGNMVISCFINTSRFDGFFEILELKDSGFVHKIKGKFDDYRFSSSLTVLARPRVQIFRKRDKMEIGTNSGTFEMDVPPHLISLSYLNDSDIAFNCSDNVFIYNYNKRNFSDIFKLRKIVNTCFKDIEGNYWFATTGYGIYKLTTNSMITFNLIVNDNSLPVYSLWKQKDTLLAGTSESLLWTINISKNILKYQRVSKDIGESRVTAIVNNNSKRILGTGQGVHYFDNGKEDSLSQKMTEFITIKSITTYSDSILITTSRGVLIMNINHPSTYDIIWNDRATCSYKFNDDFYIGTLKGLYAIDEKRETIFLGTKDRLLASRISMIIKDNNTLWIATYGNGVVGYDLSGKVIRHVTESDGLTSNMCRTLALENNTLYVGTDKGLNLIKITDTISPILTYTSKDGLNCDIINTVLVDSGTVFAGTPYGITSFNPNKIDTFSISVLNINSIKSKKNIWTDTLDNIVLEAGDNSLKIDYSGVSFKSQGNITYYYKLTGLDTGWHNTKQNVLEYASLSPDTYVLEMYAINAFGKRSNLVKINITLEKFFYQELWFYILIGAILILVTWFFVNKRFKVVKAREAEKAATRQRISELEQLAFKSQMNPHFIFNCLNSIQQYIFNKDVLEANSFITEFSSIIRQTLDISSRRSISLEEEIKYLTTYIGLEQKRFDGNFSFQISVDTYVLPERIYIPPMFLQPFVENSIRHGIRNLSGVTGNIDIRFFIKDNFLHCIIEDNGIGRKAANILKHQSGHASKGISIIQQRVETINIGAMHKISVEVCDLYPEKEDTGTKVIVRFPLEPDEI